MHLHTYVSMSRWAETDRWIAHCLTLECCMGSLTHFPKVTVEIFLIKLKVRGESVSLVLAALREGIHAALFIKLVLSDR